MNRLLSLPPRDLIMGTLLRVMLYLGTGIAVTQSWALQEKQIATEYGWAPPNCSENRIKIHKDNLHFYYASAWSYKICMGRHVMWEFIMRHTHTYTNWSDKNADFICRRPELRDKFVPEKYSVSRIVFTVPVLEIKITFWTLLSLTVYDSRFL